MRRPLPAPSLRHANVLVSRMHHALQGGNWPALASGKWSCSKFLLSLGEFKFVQQADPPSMVLRCYASIMISLEMFRRVRLQYREEKHCRFCFQELPGWKDTITPHHLTSGMDQGQALMAVVYNGKVRPAGIPSIMRLTLNYVSQSLTMSTQCSLWSYTVVQVA